MRAAIAALLLVLLPVLVASRPNAEAMANNLLTGALLAITASRSTQRRSE